MLTLRPKEKRPRRTALYIFQEYGSLRPLLRLRAVGVHTARHVKAAPIFQDISRNTGLANSTPLPCMPCYRNSAGKRF
jgi:hypothetical protein